ncbi:MAG: MFS transporter [Chloroflexi bacterium]|nr:MFS transporter [Chloroflexota bacterium]MDA1239206.1 MFS transporter [Chloroflexota bacterium]
MQRFFPRIFYGWVMVWAALVINLASTFLNAVVFSFLIGPIALSLDVPKSALAWCLTLRLVVAGISGPWLGKLIDRHGTRWLGAGCGALGGVSLILAAQANSLWVLYALFALSGLAGFGGPSGQLLTQVPLAKWFTARRGQAISIATIGMAIGTTMAIPITQQLVDGIGWRAATTIFGVVVIAVIVPVSLLFMRRAPEDMGLYPDGAAAPIPGAEVVQTRAMRLATDEDWTVQQALRTPTMWMLLVALGLSGVALTGTLVYRVDFWRSTGMSPNLVGFGTALDPFCVIFSTLLFGYLADRIQIRYLGFVGLAGLAASMVPMVVTSGETITILLHNIMWGVAAGAFITLNSVLWPNYFGRLHLGAIRGIVLPVSIAASSLGAPLIGYVLDTSIQPSHVWAAAGVAFALSAALVLIARPPRRLDHVPSPGTPVARGGVIG